MCTLLFHINVGFTMNLISGTHYLCERREYAFMVLWKYTIIFPQLLVIGGVFRRPHNVRRVKTDIQL